MKPITIIGGGLAGLTLGILLRRDNVPVAIIEAGQYPRHRVCGEFLSGNGRQILDALGLETKIANKSEASTCAFYFSGGRAIPYKLQSPALCVSRYDLDSTLAEEFQRVGGLLKTRERARDDTFAEGVVRATGRRRADPARGHLIGLKAHTVGAALSADLEMHFGPRQYVGLCRLTDGRMNVCGLFYSPEPQRDIHKSWSNILEAAVHSSALKNASWDDDSFCSVAGLTLDREAPAAQYSIGDAAAMIPPLTGNGMSMAIESAALAHPYLERYSAGQGSWGERLDQSSRAWRQEFSGRLRWAAFVQSVIFHSAGQSAFFLGARVFASLPNLFFSRTR